MISRRKFLEAGSISAGLALASPAAVGKAAGDSSLPPSIAALKSRRSEATPITRDERRQRQERAREQIGNAPDGANPDVRIWQEDESPYERIAQGLKDRGIGSGKIGIEETVKFVFVDGIAKASPQASMTSATPVTAGCRMIKSAHEVALMRLASQVTLAAYEAT